MIRIVGKPNNVSREFVRAWAWATLAVLGYHNKTTRDRVPIHLIANLHSDVGEKVAGQWDPISNRVELDRALDVEEMATTIVHELIHALVGPFGDDTDEKCTSTLCAKLKPEIAKLAEPLIEGTYRRAAFIAHTKLSYRTDEDHYDRSEDRPLGLEDKYRRNT